MFNNQHSIHSFSMGSFVWWQGVVENNVDPDMLGRVRVRMVGYHTDDKSLIPTESLPWATVSQGVTNAGVTGVGMSPVGIKQGTHCWGFFRDGNNAQDPIVCGVISGVPGTAARTNVGFNDPDGEYPRTDLIGEPDVNRLARGTITNTVIQAKIDAIKSGVSIAGGGTWDEPKTPYAAEYPLNQVHESESGHVHEVDDTPGAERLHRYHKSGTFEEIHPEGDKVTKVVTNNYTITMGNDFAYIEGNCNITVGGNANIKVDGNSTINTAGNHTEEVGGNMELKVGGTMTVESGGPMKFTAPRIDLN